MSAHSIARDIGGRRVVVACARELQPLAGDVLTTFERLARSEGGLRPDLRVRFGWSRLVLRPHDDDALIVCEPDFGGDPLRDVRPRVDTTLSVLADQAGVLRRAGMTAQDSTFEQLVVVARGALSAASLNLFRSEPSDESDSGWSVTAADAPESTSPKDFEAVRAYLFLQMRRVVLSVLMLPVGTAVVIDGDEVVMVLDDSGTDRLHERRAPGT
jgi:hypothetical protein